MVGDWPHLRHIRAPEHALPYRVIFEEMLATGKQSISVDGKTFEAIVADAFAAYDEGPDGVGGNSATGARESAYARIFNRISQVELGYGELAKKVRRKEDTSGYQASLSRLEMPLLELMHRIPRSALCLSGGGIRSAAYSLGVLEALARARGPGGLTRYNDPAAVSTLQQIDYLSTVSGGGYIGSWLIGWTQRLYNPPGKSPCLPKKKSSPSEPDPRSAAKPMSPGEAFHAVSRGLAGDVEHTSADPAQRPIRRLRRYTSFLAPKLGLTLDTWTLFAIVMRNLLVNWVMILPVIFAAAAGAQTLRYGIFWLAGVIYRHPSGGWWFAIGALFIFAGATAALRMPSCPPPDRSVRSNGVQAVLLCFILPLGIGSLFLVEFWANLGLGWLNAREALFQRFLLAAFLTLVVIPLIRLFRSRSVVTAEHSPRNYALAGAGAALLIAIVFASVAYSVGWAFIVAGNPQAASHSPGSLLHLQWSQFQRWISLPIPSIQAHGMRVLERGTSQAHWFVLFAFPIFWLLLIGASSLFSGVLGIFEEDVDREWWARSSGLMMAVLAMWIFGVGIVMLGPALTHSVSKAVGAAVAAVVTGLTGTLGGAGTAGGLGAAAAKKANITKIGSFLNKHGLVLPTLCGVALLILAAFIASLETWIAGAFGNPQSGRFHLYIFLAALLSSLLINWMININLFSLHGMYRMRLIRAFLGASNTQRVANPFTGFDDRDNVYEAAIPTGPGMPLHVINATVNLVGTDNPAWRQRKAEGFTISPLHCGSWRLGYASTKVYGRQGGLSLGTAMAISGAAFNPNMGYHSSPLVTLMMTLLNVRLGWWLPNPGYCMSSAQAKLSGTLEPSVEGGGPEPDPLCPQPLPNEFLQKKAPRLALGPLLREAFGGTNDNGAFIELTDGGHFENLGLYEMVLRRARWIVVVDASADPNGQLEDLGNAMRKIEIDLGVSIVFGRDGLRMKAGPDQNNLYCALAAILYEVVDPVRSPMRGQLLYIKAGLNGKEPPDITQYARTHPSFPHESTANQFFTEAQFESYRHLGHHSVHAILAKGHAVAGAKDKIPAENPAGPRPAVSPVETSSAGTEPLVEALFAAARSYIDRAPAPSPQTQEADSQRE